MTSVLLVCVLDVALLACVSDVGFVWFAYLMLVLLFCVVDVGVDGLRVWC